MWRTVTWVIVSLSLLSIFPFSHKSKVRLLLIFAPSSMSLRRCGSFGERLRRTFLFPLRHHATDCRTRSLLRRSGKEEEGERGPRRRAAAAAAPAARVSSCGERTDADGRSGGRSVGRTVDRRTDGRRTWTTYAYGGAAAPLAALAISRSLRGGARYPFAVVKLCLESF